MAEESELASVRNRGVSKAESKVRRLSPPIEKTARRSGFFYTNDILLVMKQIITSLLYLLTIFCVSHFIFEPTHLYYEIKWLDIPMHIMGGFGVASLVSSIYSYKGKSVSFWTLFFTYTAVAITWEVYEYIRAVMTYSETSGIVDTIKDYIDGLIGMSLAYSLIRK